MTHAALFALPALPPEPSGPAVGPAPEAVTEDDDGQSITFGPTLLSRACARVVLGGYALSVKIEKVSEALAFRLQDRGIL